MGADTVHPIVQTDSLFGKIPLNNQGRIFIGDNPDLPIRRIVRRTPVSESIHFRGGKRFIPWAERTKSTTSLDRLDEKVSRSLPSLLGDDYPSAKYRISTKFRHTPLQTF
jgi:hypothetical protein